MLACLNPCDAQMDENLSTLSYASKASFISNKPIKNEDPKNQQIADLKRQIKILTEELANANETINFLSSLTGQNPQMIGRNLGRNISGGPRGSTPTHGIGDNGGNHGAGNARNMDSGSGNHVGPGGKQQPL